MPELKQLDHDAAARAQAAHAIEERRRVLFGSAGNLISPAHWSSDPATMQRLADELELFLCRAREIVTLPSVQEDWLAKRMAGEVGP